jgi:hypothetical protein
VILKLVPVAPEPAPLYADGLDRAAVQGAASAEPSSVTGHHATANDLPGRLAEADTAPIMGVIRQPKSAGAS